MNRDEQRKNLKYHREQLIKDLETFYTDAFNQLSELDLNEIAIAKLTQILLQSRDGAITPLEKKIERPIITTAPSKS